MEVGRPKPGFQDKFIRTRNGDYAPVGRLCQTNPYRLETGRSRLALDWADYCEFPPENPDPIPNPDPECTWALYRKALFYKVRIEGGGGPTTEYIDFRPFASYFDYATTLGELLYNGFEVVVQGVFLLAPLVYDRPDGNAEPVFVRGAPDPGPGVTVTLIIEEQVGWLRDNDSIVNVCEPIQGEPREFIPEPFIPIPDWFRTVIPEVGKQMLPNPFRLPFIPRPFDPLPNEPNRRLAAPPVTIPRPTWKPVPFERVKPREPAKPYRDPKSPTPAKPDPQRKTPRKPPRRKNPKPQPPTPQPTPDKPPLPGKPRQPRRRTPGPRTPDTPAPRPRRPPTPERIRDPDTPKVPIFPRPVPNPRPRPVPNPRPTPRPVPRPNPRPVPNPIPRPPTKPPLPYGPPQLPKPAQPKPRPIPAPPTPKPLPRPPLPPSPWRPPTPIPSPYPYPEPRPNPSPRPTPRPRPLPIPLPFPPVTPSPNSPGIPSPFPQPSPRPRPAPQPQPQPRPVPAPQPSPLPNPSPYSPPDMQCPPCPELVRERIVPVPIPGPPGRDGNDGNDGKDGDSLMMFIIQDAIPPAIQDIEFSDGNIGQYSAVLPARLAFVDVEIIGDTLPKDRFGLASDGNQEFKAGTLTVCRNGLPISTYSMARFQRATLPLPMELEPCLSVYIRPTFPCTVRVVYDGSTYQVRKIAPSDTIPVIDPINLLD